MFRFRIKNTPRYLSFVAMCCALVACATPYDPPIILSASESSVSSFPGIRQFASNGDLRVVWIHGMCSHDASWAHKRQRMVNAILDTVPAAGETRDVRDENDLPYTIKTHTRYSGHDIEIRYYIWSPATRAAKKRLVEDSDQSEFKRANLNASLKKTLMNDCLSDAVAYLGKPGDQIRTWLKSQVCDAMNGKIGSGGRCQSVTPLDRPVIFISESLGSKMLSDAVQDVWDSSSGGSKAALALNISRVQMYFVISNQIPMLNVAEFEASQKEVSGTPLTQPGLRVFEQVRTAFPVIARIDLPPLHFVEFTDPNDLLSYRLTSQDLEPGIKLTNVVVSNGPTYFGYLENPVTAHCGYQWNRYVLGTILKGYSGGAVETVDLPSDGEGCL